MTARLKTFVLGAFLGALVAFFLGMNYGKGAPLLSNPFAERHLSDKIKDKAEKIADNAREKIHEATRK